MKILLVNPPNCGKSIPEEHYGVTVIKATFNGEPLCLEELAGNLEGHEIKILDLKVEPDGLKEELINFKPDIVGITGVTCEANYMKKIAVAAKTYISAITVVGGQHATHDPDFFNHPDIDYIVLGLGKKSFRELVDNLDNRNSATPVRGVLKTSNEKPLRYELPDYSFSDIVENKPPRYDLVEKYRGSYVIQSIGEKVGMISSSYGCTGSCNFCAIKRITGQKYFIKNIESIIAEIRLLDDIPVIRFADANTFVDINHSRKLLDRIRQENIKKKYIANIRADTIVKNPELITEWHRTGLEVAVVGFEDICDKRLKSYNKNISSEFIPEAIRILKSLGVRIIGDFIISPDYSEKDFDDLKKFILKHKIDLPLSAILTPIPGTPVYEKMKDRIIVKDLDYYTFSNAVTDTLLPEDVFYKCYSDLLNL